MMKRCRWILCSALFVGWVALHGQASAASITDTTAAIGKGCVASGGFSTAMGRDTTASGDYSTAMGVESTADGVVSTAMGNDTTASGHSSTAMGTDTTASGASSTAMGRDTTASGDYSTAMGSNTTASGVNSTAMGAYTTAGNNYDTVIGKGFDNSNRLISNLGNSFMVGYMTDASDATPEFLVKDGGVGINNANPQTAFHVNRTVSGSPTLANHAAAIENIAVADDPNVLMLKVSIENPGPPCNFVTFGDSAKNLGSIEGNGSGGVSLNTSGGDFAEYLPKADPNETLTPGDIVGLFPEGLSKKTHHAQRVMVVSTAPAVLGNRPGEKDASRYAPTAFLGQVPVRVEGAVRSGDYIVPSGREDGIGRAVPPAKLIQVQYGAVVGRALQTHPEEGIKGVTVLIGLPQDGFWSKAMETKDARISQLEGRLAALEARSGNGSGLGLLPGAGIIMGSLGFFWMDRRRRRA